MRELTQSTAREASKRLDHLDGIRGIAAFSVMIGHIRWPSAIATLPPFNNISLWVDFFFVLSGFVIAHTYFERISRGLPVASFMARRFARLYPLHLLMLFAALAYEIVKWKAFGTVSIDANKAPFETNNLASFVGNLFLVHALGPFPDATWNGPSWSISVEFYIYLTFAVLVASARARRPIFWVSLVSLQLFSIAVLVTCTHGDFLSVETDYGFFRCILGFGLGVVVQHFYATRKDTAAEDSRDWLKALLAVPICVLISTSTYNKTPLTLFAPFLFAAFIWLLVRHRGGVFERLLLSRACQIFGALSYSIYMTHGLFHGGLQNAWRLAHRSDLFQNGWGATLLNEGLTIFYVAIVLAVSWFSYRAVELPAQRWLNKHFDRPQPRLAATGDATFVKA